VDEVIGNHVGSISPGKYDRMHVLNITVKRCFVLQGIKPGRILPKKRATDKEYKN